MSSTIKDVRNRMFEIIGHIDYDDIDDLDTNWRSLADTLKDLPYSRQISFRKPKPKDGVVAAALEDIDKAYPVNLDSLVKLVRTMEELSRLGSGEALDEKDLAQLRNKAAGFEREFDAFTKNRLPSFLKK